MEIENFELTVPIVAKKNGEVTYNRNYLVVFTAVMKLKYRCNKRS